jgi:predicted dehydrogenase
MFLSVTTPPQVHRIVALEAVRRGVNVFIEKPLVLKYSDAVEVIGEARSRGVKLGVVANYLFTPTMVKARELVKKGVVGDLKRVDVIVYAPEDVILSGGSGWIKSLPEGVFRGGSTTSYLPPAKPHREVRFNISIFSEDLQEYLAEMG